MADAPQKYHTDLVGACHTALKEVDEQKRKQWASFARFSVLPSEAGRRVHFVLHAIRCLFSLAPEHASVLLDGWAMLLDDFGTRSERWVVQHAICCILWVECDSLLSLLPAVLSFPSAIHRSAVLWNYYRMPLPHRSVPQLTNFLGRSSLVQLLNSVLEAHLEQFLNVFGPLSGTCKIFWCAKLWLLFGGFTDGTTTTRYKVEQIFAGLLKARDRRTANLRNRMVQALRLVPDFRTRQLLLARWEPQWNNESPNSRANRFCRLVKFR